MLLSYHKGCVLSLLGLIVCNSVTSNKQLPFFSDEQFVLKRVADGAIDLYAMVVVLSR